jgi:phospholipid-binding lipoprotein MlaA
MKIRKITTNLVCLLLFSGLFLTSCQRTNSNQDLTEDEKMDPFEPFNRKIFEFNMIVDGLLLEPMATAYSLSVPDDVQKGISNFLNNLSEPVTLANDTLQGKGERALETFSRFMINSVIGVFGIFDVAEKLGLPDHKEDFGQTLGEWKVPSGPYLVLPLIGSTTPRALAGRVTDFYLSPYNYYVIHKDKRHLIYVRMGAETLVKRAQHLDDIRNFRENSVDFYAAVRSFYIQHWRSEQKDGKIDNDDMSYLDDMFDDEGNY